MWGGGMRKGVKFERTKHRETILDLGGFPIRPKFRKCRLVSMCNQMVTSEIRE